MELRVLQIIDNEDVHTLDQRPELQTIGLLLDYLIHELSCKNNFEFIQAVIKLFLKVCIFFRFCYRSLEGLDFYSFAYSNWLFESIQS